MVNSGGSVERRVRVTRGGTVVGLVRHVVHGGAASVRGIIACSGSRGVPVGERLIRLAMMMLMMVRRVWRRGSGVIEVL